MSPDKARAPGQEIVVSDMDHTLLECDLTVASLQLFLKRRPHWILSLLIWYLRAKSVAKAKLAKFAMPDVASAPQNPDVVSFLKARKAEGAWLVLASASNEKIVRAVAERFAIFDQALGSVPGNSFKGKAKALGLRKAFGEQGYTYLGDSPSDLPVWADANEAVTVGAPENLRKRVEGLGKKVVHLCPK